MKDSIKYFEEQKVKKIIDEIFEKHGHIFDALWWREEPKGTPMPDSLKKYLQEHLFPTRTNT